MLSADLQAMKSKTIFGKLLIIVHQFYQLINLGFIFNNRYLMGVGYPVDLVVCSCLGCDMFDCVFSTRTARFGTAFTKNGFLRIKGGSFITDF